MEDTLVKCLPEVGTVLERIHDSEQDKLSSPTVYILVVKLGITYTTMLGPDMCHNN